MHVGRWAVKSTPVTGKDINTHRSATCRLRLRVKWANEPDWIDHIIWKVPGWEPLAIWKEAYNWIHEQNKYYKELTREDALVEEARLDEFKLV